ncbi:MAG: DAHL domain-containing protein [Bdellovibrionota bacterium]
MRRYFLLPTVIFFGLAGISFFYYQNKNHLLKENESFTNSLTTLKQVETSLDKDILRDRGFLLLNYDSIVVNSEKLTQICYQLKFGKNQNLQVLKAINEYCAYIETKTNNVEIFKSKNAVLKNSVFYIHRMQAESKEYNGYTLLSQQLIRAALSYYLISSPEAKDILQKYILRAESNTKTEPTKNEELHSLLLHSKIILNKDELDKLIQEVFSSEEASSQLSKLSAIYFDNYNNSIKVTSFYIQIIYLLSLLISLFMIYVIVNRWKAGKKSQNAIIDQQKQALITSAKMSALGEMAGGIAHEINTPLATISMKIEQLEEEIAAENIVATDLVQSLSTIKNTTLRIAKIIKGLRTFSKDSSRMPFEMCAVNALIDETLSFCKEKFKTHGVQIEINYNGLNPDLLIECRSVEISQVLLNLLNNSFDAVQTLEHKWIKIEVCIWNEFIKFNIVDSGSGVSKNIQSKIMQPFFTTKEVGKGTGLGLSISSGIVESHHGKLFLDTECLNTKFTILLPKNN